MQIHRFRGRTLHDALVRAREAHGEGAVVVSHESGPDGGVTVAVARSSPAGATATLRRPGAVAGPAAGVGLADGEVDPGLAEVRARLEATGASEGLVARVARGVRESGAKGAYAIDSAAVLLGREAAAAPSPKVGGATQVVALVGPTGVGKTTTVAKLAARLARSGRSVALATTDAARPGAVEQLAARADDLGLPLAVARSARELAGALAAHRDADALLVDTAGHSPFDARSLKGLGRALAGTSERRSLTTYLVLAATAQPEALDEALRGFRACPLDACVLTKLDETRRPASALEFVRFAQLSVAFLCDGQDVARHIHRPRPSHFADLFLRGRLS